MPTTPINTRILLKKGKAGVAHRVLFTIQLNNATGETKQLITLGIDAGYSNIGFSAIINKQELIAGEVMLRKDVSKKITAKRMHRMTRRGRLWYRMPHFLNRTHAKKKGWLAPSIRHKLETHIRLIEKIKQILPISAIIIEIATFDSQKMQYPEIKGVEYQQGELQGYAVHEYLLAKWERKCTYYDKSGRVSNLTMARRKCNLKKANKTAEEFGHSKAQHQAKKTLKSVAFMNTVRKRMVEKLNCQSSFGFIIKLQRTNLGLLKSHINDVFVIAGGITQ